MAQERLTISYKLSRIFKHLYVCRYPSQFTKVQEKKNTCKAILFWLVGLCAWTEIQFSLLYKGQKNSQRKSINKSPPEIFLILPCFTSLGIKFIFCDK